MATRPLKFRNKNGDWLDCVLTITRPAREGVIFLHGMGRDSDEMKFGVLAEELDSRGICTFRFDSAGWGRSRGNLVDQSLERMVGDFIRALEVFEEATGFSDFGVFAHSYGACVLAECVRRNMRFRKMVLMAPALNQKGLTRYWFVRKNNSFVTWFNYRSMLDEKAFLASCQENRKVKGKEVGAQFFAENACQDFAPAFLRTRDRVLHIHGSRDKVVPVESVSLNFSNFITVKDGDHDLEEKEMIDRWLPSAVTFLTI